MGRSYSSIATPPWRRAFLTANSISGRHHAHCMAGRPARARVPDGLSETSNNLDTLPKRIYNNYRSIMQRLLARDRPEIWEVMTIGIGPVGYVAGWGLWASDHFSLSEPDPAEVNRLLHPPAHPIEIRHPALTGRRLPLGLCNPRMADSEPRRGSREVKRFPDVSRHPSIRNQDWLHATQSQPP
jgi:hypothetical protein